MVGLYLLFFEIFLLVARIARIDRANDVTPKMIEQIFLSAPREKAIFSPKNAPRISAIIGTI